jgi:uncharacterized protein YggL (DUF469 family)
MIMRALANIAVFIALGLGIACLFVARSHDPGTPQAGRETTPHAKNFARRLDAKVAQDELLRMGFDVQVSVIEEDDSKMIVYGRSVNRPFAHNLMERRDFKKMLHNGEFTEVTFMDSISSPGFVQTFAVDSRPLPRK